MGYFINRNLVSKDVYYKEYADISIELKDLTKIEDGENVIVSATVPVKHSYFDFEITKIQYQIQHQITTPKIETDTATEIYFTAGEEVVSIIEKDADNKLILSPSTPIVLTDYIGQEIQINIVFNKEIGLISKFSSWIKLVCDYTSPDFSQDDFENLTDYFSLIDKILLSRGFSSSVTTYSQQMKVENGRIFFGRGGDPLGHTNIKLYLSKYFFLNKDEEGFQKNNTTPLFEESIDIIRHGDTITDEQKELVSKYSINIDHFYNVEFEKAYQEPLTAYKDSDGWYIFLYDPEQIDSWSFMVDITDMIVRFKTPNVSSADIQSFCARRCKPPFDYSSEKYRFVTSTLNEIATLCDVYDVSSETTTINNFPVRIIWEEVYQWYVLSFNKYDETLDHNMTDGLYDKQKMEWSFLDKKKVNYNLRSSITIDTDWRQLFHVQTDVKRTYFNPPLSKPKNGEVLTDYLKLNLKDIEVKNTNNYTYNSEKAVWVLNREYIDTSREWTKNLTLPEIPYIKINSYTTLKTGKTNKPATYNYIQKNGWIPIIPSNITSSYSGNYKFSLKYSFKLDDMALCRGVEEGFLWKIPDKEDETTNKTTTLSQLAFYLGFINSPIYELSETDTPENGVSEFSKTVSNNYLQKINSSSLDAGKTKFIKMSHYVVTDQDTTYQFTLATHPSRQKPLTSDKYSGQFLLDKGFTYNTSTPISAAYWGVSDLIYPEIVFNTTIFPLFFNSIRFSIRSDRDSNWLLIYNGEESSITDVNGKVHLIDKKYHLDPNDVVVFYIRQQSTTLPTASTSEKPAPWNYKKWSGITRNITNMATTLTINEPTMKVYSLTETGTISLKSSGVVDSTKWKEVTDKKHLFTSIIQKAPAHEENWYIKEVADYIGSYERDEWFCAGTFNTQLTPTDYLNWTITAKLPVIPYISVSSISNPSAVVAYTSNYKKDPSNRTHNEDMTAYFWEDSEREERWVGEMSAKFLSGAGILPKHIPLMETSETNRHTVLREGGVFVGGDVTIDDRYFFNNEDKCYWYTSTFKDTSWFDTVKVFDIKQQLINKNYIADAVAVVIWRNGKTVK